MVISLTMIWVFHPSPTKTSKQGPAYLPSSYHLIQVILWSWDEWKYPLDHFVPPPGHEYQAWLIFMSGTGGLMAPPHWGRASMSELCFGSARSFEKRTDVQPGKGRNSGTCTTKELCCSVSAGVGFHLRFLLSLRIDRILKPQFTWCESACKLLFVCQAAASICHRSH